jgi:hypothetical protein
MAASVQQHVCESVPNLTWRSQYAEVVALGEYRAPAVERPVHGPRDAGTEGHHPAAEPVGAARLDEKVRVRPLESIVDEVKVGALANRREAALERADERDRSQRRQSGEKLHGHVSWVAGRDVLTRSVRNARLGSSLASGAESGTPPICDAPGAEGRPARARQLE